jgi:N6-L-threonylcarbamoyladenine synthase
MAIVLGIESTAHTFGIGIVRNGKILSNVRDMYTTESGGMIPVDSAKHHREVCERVYSKALEDAGLSGKEKEIDAIAFSQGPGLPPCLIEGMKFAKKLSKKLKKPLVPVNHCVAHLEVGGVTGAKDPVLLYCSGANTQVIAYAAGKYRIFGETLDVGVGNFIDNFARYAGIGFPGGPKIEKIASQGKRYVELPYTVKGMDVAFSGILTNLRQKLEKLGVDTKSNLHQPFPAHPPKDNSINRKQKLTNLKNKEVDYTLADLSFSMQETVFAMLIETAERALAHINKKELLLGGGVACNSRLQEMAQIMCSERDAKCFIPPKSLLVDNGAMIAYLGEIMFNSGIRFSGTSAQELDIKPRERTDQVDVSWRRI